MAAAKGSKVRLAEVPQEDSEESEKKPLALIFRQNSSNMDGFDKKILNAYADGYRCVGMLSGNSHIIVMELRGL